LVLVLGTMGQSSPVNAGPTFFLTTYGGRFLGLGGTHIALCGSVMALQANPAELLCFKNSYLEFGTPLIFGRMDYVDDFNSLDLVNPSLSFANDISPRTFALIPWMGIAAPINDNMAWGMAVYAQAGGGVDINGIVSILPISGAPVGRPGGERIPLAFTTTIQDNYLAAFFLKATPGFAYRRGKLRVGVGLDVTFGLQESLQTFYRQTPEGTRGEKLLEFKYTSDPVVTWGGKIGVTYEVTDNLKVAYAYMLKNEFQFDGDFTENDQGAFTDATVENHFTLPDRHTIGLAYASGPWTLVADANMVRYAAYFKTRRLGLSEPLFPGGATVTKIPLDYDDQFFYSGGVEYKPKNFAYRIGYHYGKSSVEEGNITLTENLIVAHHGQVGFGFRKGRADINAALEIAFKNSFTGDERTDWANQRFFAQSDSYTISLRQTNIFISVGYDL
jgi:long-chain fatty acid transport protein